MTLSEDNGVWPLVQMAERYSAEFKDLVLSK